MHQFRNISINWNKDCPEDNGILIKISKHFFRFFRFRHIHPLITCIISSVKGWKLDYFILWIQNVHRRNILWNLLSVNSIIKSKKLHGDSIFFDVAYHENYERSNLGLKSGYPKLRVKKVFRNKLVQIKPEIHFQHVKIFLDNSFAK